MIAKINCVRNPALAGAMQKLSQRIADRGADAVRAGAKVLLDAALEIVPRDTEELAGSGRIEVAGTGGDAVAFVGFGGDPSNTNGRWVGDRHNNVVYRIPALYALRVHEDSSMPHPYGGRYNYLREPAATKEAEVSRAISEELKR